MDRITKLGRNICVTLDGVSEDPRKLEQNFPIQVDSRNRRLHQHPLL